MSDCLFENLEPRLMMDADAIADLGSWADAQALQFQETGYYRQARFSSFVDDATDSDLFWFTAEESGTTRIVMKRTGDLMPRIVLYDSEGQKIDHHSTTGSHAVIDFEAQQGQTYYLMAHGCRASVGKYYLRMRNMESGPSPVSRDLVDGWGHDPYQLNPVDAGRFFYQQYRSSITGWGDVDLFSFTANFTGTARFYLKNRTPSRLNVKMRLYDGDWNLIDAQWSGRGFATYEKNVTAGETYNIVASGNGQYGYYDVQVRALEGSELPNTPQSPWVDPAPQPAPDDSDPAPQPDPEPQPNVDPVDVAYSGGVLTITGTADDDTVGLSQDGSTIYVVNAGQTRTYAGVTKISVRLGDGNDEISLGNVSLTSWIWGEAGDDVINGGVGVDHIFGGAGADVIHGREGADILVSVGGGADIVHGDYGWDQFWSDDSDTLYSTSGERSGGYVNVIGEFYQPYTTDSSSGDYVPLDLQGQNFRDPTVTNSAYVYADYSGYELFTDGPELRDIRQGYVGDCYFLATLAGIANVDAQLIRNAVVDLGDGTYAVRYMRSGEANYIRVDGDLPARYGQLVYARMNGDQELWVALMEKAYAHFRRNSDSYLSISGGWMSEVYYAITGASGEFDWVSGASGSTVYNLIAGNLAAGQVVTIGSKSSATSPIAVNHAYTVDAAWTDGSGQRWVRVYNPWGYDGFSYDSNSGDGLVTLRAQDVGNYFSAVCSVAV